MTHDYTVRDSGHDFTIMNVDGVTLDVSGWGVGISAGDYLLLPNGERSTRYQVETIFYYPDPPDMWQADLRFAPREES